MLPPKTKTDADKQKSHCSSRASLATVPVLKANHYTRHTRCSCVADWYTQTSRACSYTNLILPTEAVVRSWPSSVTAPPLVLLLPNANQASTVADCRVWGLKWQRQLLQNALKIICQMPSHRNFNCSVIHSRIKKRQDASFPRYSYDGIGKNQNNRTTGKGSVPI